MYYFLSVVFTLLINTSAYSFQGADIESDNALNSPELSVATAYEDAKKTYYEGVKTRLDISKDKIFSGTDTGLIQYFDEKPEKDCSNYEALACPPLNSTFSDDHITMIDWINPSSGEVQCSVYEKNGGKFGSTWNKIYNEDEKLTPITTQKFTKKICAKEFLEANFNNTSDRFKALLSQVEKDNERISEVKDSLEVFEAGETTLDIPDIIEAVITLNSEVIDLDSTILKQELMVQPRYNLNDITNSDLSREINRQSSVFKSKTEEEITKSIEDGEYSENKSFELFNHLMASFLNILTQLNVYYNLIFLVLISTAALWNFSSSGLAIKNDQTSKAEFYKNLLIGMGLFVILIRPYEHVINNTETTNDNNKQIVIDFIQLQNYIRFVITEANEKADELVAVINETTFNIIKHKSGGVDELVVKAYGSELLSQEAQKIHLTNIDKYWCEKYYDTAKLKDTLQKYRKDKLNEKSTASYLTLEKDKDNKYLFQKEYNLLNINPYPRSEQEAFNILKDNSINPYDIRGFVKTGVSFTPQDKFLSLSGCYKNIKKIQAVNARINSIDKKITYFESPDITNSKIDHLIQLQRIMDDAQHKFGYVSVAFIPAFHALSGKNSKIINEVEKELSTIESISKYTVSLMLFNGNAIADSVNSLVGGTLITKPFALYGTGVLIQELLDMISWMIILIVSIAAFIFLFLEQLKVFYFSPFKMVALFSNKQLEKAHEVVIDIVSLGIRLILIVSMTVIAIFFSQLLDLFSFYTVHYIGGEMNNISINDEFSFFSFDTTKNIINYFSRALFSGVAMLLFDFMKVLISVYLIFKLPSEILEWIFNQFNKSADSVSNIIDSAKDKTLNKTGM